MNEKSYQEYECVKHVLSTLPANDSLKAQHTRMPCNIKNYIEKFNQNVFILFSLVKPVVHKNNKSSSSSSNGLWYWRHTITSLNTSVYYIHRMGEHVLVLVVVVIASTWISLFHSYAWNCDGRWFNRLSLFISRYFPIDETSDGSCYGIAQTVSTILSRRGSRPINTMLFV